MDIANWIWERVDADPALTEPAKLLIVAAVEGEQEFGEFVGAPTKPTPTADAAEPARAFLAGLEVEGYRGIGPKAQLTFTPAPGLVVVAGRNGSGKSSFAEALDWALNQHTSRAAKFHALWEDQWRNLHHSPTGIRATFVIEGQARTTVGLDWSAGVGSGDYKAWTQRVGEQRRDGVAELGWKEPLELYSPMLSYDELGGILEGKPSELYDALESFLGLERLTEAARRLRERTRDLEEPGKKTTEAAKLAKNALEPLSDARAQTVLAVIGSRKQDAAAIAAVEDALAGSASTADPALAALAHLANVVLPPIDQVMTAATELVEAETELRDATEAAAAAHQERTELLAAALRHYDDHGEGPCPVCGEGTLNTAWRQQAAAEVEAGRELTDRISGARQRVSGSRSAWQVLAPSRPVQVDSTALDLPDLEEARSAWTDWESVRTDPTGQPGGHLQEVYGRLSAASSALAAAAAEEHQRRQDRWLDVLPLITNWFESRKQAETVADELATAKAAETWLKNRTAELRNERLQPLADQAREIWSKLRQESNVDLGSVTLEGSATRRRVDLRGSVDGAQTSTLAVMSQGELHALGLALFIPRACAAESPFGFLVLDDPIQAMDPGKIDGFVEVLTEIAKTRQVIVFSHDDRLPECLRRMSVPARIREIVRGQNSEVSVRDISEPTDRYLADALAVAKDEAAADADRRMVIPGLCRMALETACQEIVYARELGAGKARADVETDWNDLHTTSQRVQAALDRDHLGVTDWLSSRGKARLGLGICTKGFHQGLVGVDPVDAVRAAEALIRDLQAAG